MTTLRVVRMGAAAVVGGILAAILGGLAAGGFATEGRQLLELTWGRVTIVDLYLGFSLVWGWIAWRERSVLRALVWLAATITLGALALGTYVLGASLRADSVPGLLLGPHHVSPPAS